MVDRTPRKLVEILVSRGVVPLEECRRAERLAREAGIAVDTAILELNLVDEDLLVETLAQGLGVPPAHATELTTPDPEALARVPKKLARNARLVAFRLTGTRLSVAMRGFDDLGLLDELAFVTSRRIEPCFALEVRLDQALARTVGGVVAPRVRALAERLDQRRAASRESQSAELLSPIEEEAMRPDSGLPVAGRASGAVPATPGLPESPAPESALEVLAPVSLGDDTAPVLGATRPPADAAGVASPPAAAALADPVAEIADPPADPLAAAAAVPVVERLAARPENLEQLGERLAEVRERDAVAELVADYLAARCRRVVLAMIRGKEVAGWLARGPGIDSPALSDLRIPLADASAFRDLRDSGRSYVGPLADLPAHRRLTALWGGELPQRCAIHPIAIRGRLVATLYVDGDDVHELEDELAAIASKAGIAFEICILRLKLMGG